MEEKLDPSSIWKIKQDPYIEVCDARRTPKERSSWARLMDQDSLNGQRPHSKIQSYLCILPASVPTYTDVILISLYVIACMMSGGVTVQDFVGLFNPWGLFIRLFPFFAPQREPPDVMQHQICQLKRFNRLLLQRFLILAVLMPGMSPFVNGLSPRLHSRSPTTTVANTGILCGANLETLKTNIDRSQHVCPLVIPGGTESLPLLLDWGASASTSPSLDGLVPGTLAGDVPGDLSIKGVGGNVRIEKMGIVHYTTVDDQGHPFKIRTAGLYMPELPQRLFSPQIYFSTGSKGGSLLIQEGEACLESTSGQRLSLPLDPTSRLYYLHCFQDAQSMQIQADALSDSLDLTSNLNTNLS
jgi:hypothetical protein